MKLSNWLPLNLRSLPLEKEPRYYCYTAYLFVFILFLLSVSRSLHLPSPRIDTYIHTYIHSFTRNYSYTSKSTPHHTPLQQNQPTLSVFHLQNSTTPNSSSLLPPFSTPPENTTSKKINQTQKEIQRHIFRIRESNPGLLGTIS